VTRGRLRAVAVLVALVVASCRAEDSAPAPAAPQPTTTLSAPAGTEPVTPPPTGPAPDEVPTTTPLPEFSAPSEQLFDQSVLHEIDIEISDDDIALIDPPTDDRVPVTLTVDGTTVYGAGLRLKGGFAQNQGLDEKPGFSIETDEFVDDLTVFDVDRFTLGNAAWDHSFVNEPLVYEAYRAAGIPAPRTALARVTVNGETFGLYVMRETWKKRMLAQHFADPSGNLYESTGVPEGPNMGLELRTNKRDGDTSDVDAVVAVVENASAEDFRAAIEELVDVDQLLTYWVVEALVGHHDGYAYDLTAPGLFPDAVHPPLNPSPNNFYAYHDPTTDRFVFLPHGADIALGLGAWNTYEVGPSAPVLLPPKVTASIASRLWDDSTFRTEYAARTTQVLDGVWDAPALIALADELAGLVRSDGLAGTREAVTMDDFEQALADRIDFLARRADAVRSELASQTSANEPVGGG